MGSLRNDRSKKTPKISSQENTLIANKYKK